MSLLLDILVIFFAVFFVISGIKRGFFRSIMGIVVVVVALIGATKLTPPMANYLHDKYIGKLVSEQVEGALENLIADIDTIDINKLFEEKPPAFTEILDTFGISFNDLQTYFDQDLAGDDNAEHAVTQYIAEPLSGTLSRGIAFFALFCGIALILSIVVHILNLVVKLPILHQANTILGAILGGVLGFLFAWGISMVLCTLLPKLAIIYENIIPASVIENTVIVKLLGRLNLLSLAHF